MILQEILFNFSLYLQRKRNDVLWKQSQSVLLIKNPQSEILFFFAIFRKNLCPILPI